MKRKFAIAGFTLGVIGAVALSQHQTTAPEAWAGEWSTETRDLEDFTSVRLSGAFEGEITVGSGHSVEISGEGDLSKLVQTRVKDGELEIQQTRSSWRDDSIEIVISVESLEEVVVDGAAELEIDGVNSDSFELRLPGAAEVEVSGTCGDLVIVIAGAASVDAESLECDTADVSIAGTGEVSVYAREKAKARISGLGSIEIHGDPGTVERKIAGLGSIEVY